MKQSQRVRVFAGGFFIGCVIAAGIAFLRSASDHSNDPAPLSTFERSAEAIPLPDLPFEHEKAFSIWVSPETGETRWLVQDDSKNLWRVSRLDEQVEILRANEIRVDGNPGIETPALRAGLEHNEFEILTFDPLTKVITVKISPFQPNAIEESVQLLISRDPYILDAAPIPYEETNSEESPPN